MRPRMGILVWALTMRLGALAAAAQVPTTQPAPPPATQPATSAPATQPGPTTTSAPASQGSDPVEVIREFLIALETRDEAAIRRVIVPHADARVLWDGGPVTERQRAEVAQRFAAMTARELQAGDVAPMPGGRALRVRDHHLSPVRRLFWPAFGEHPMPTALWVVWRDGQWKIDVEQIIADRLKGPKAPAPRPARAKPKP